MADEKITELDEKTTLAANDQFVTMDEEATPDQTKRILWPNILKYAISQAVLTTRGDTIFRGASVAERLAKGTEGQFYRQGANDPEWGNAPDVTAEAITLYVDAGSGNDNNAGTSGSPKATIQGALDALPVIIAHACTICVRGQQDYAESNAALDFSRFATLAAITIKTINPSDEDMYDNGVADAGAGNNELDDATKDWSADQFNGAYVWIFHGTGEGQIREISGTAATKLTVTVNWTTNPDATSYYAIGGGATVTGTDSYHALVSGKLVNFYGFKHSGATVNDIRVDQGGIINVGNNYFATSVRGIGAYWLGVIAGTDPGYNYIAATISGIDMSGLAYGVIRGNVITGAAKGIRLYYESIAAGSDAAHRQNHIMNCTVGISIESGSGMPEASSQSFGAGGDANGADIDPAVSTTIPRWYT